VVGLVLSGSRAAGTFVTERSDFDVFLVQRRPTTSGPSSTARQSRPWRSPWRRADRRPQTSPHARGGDDHRVSRRKIIGKPAGSVTRHEANEEVGRRLFATLAATGALHSTAVVTRPDAEEWSIEFHMRPTEAADGYVVVMRRIQ
jgi:hypothetical protein